MKRIVNVRLLFIALVGMVLGILGFDYIVPNFFVVIILLSTVAISIILSLYFLKVKNINNKKTYARLKIVFIFILFIIVGVSSMQIKSNYVINNIHNISGEYIVHGEVEDNYYENEKYTFFTLNNVVVEKDNVSIKLNSRMKVVYYDTGILNKDNIYSNKIVKFKASVETNEFNNEGYNYSYYIDNVAYFAKNISNLEVFEGSYDVDEYIREFFKNKIFENMNDTNGKIAYSLIFGNDEILPEGVMTSFKISGAVHVISVSGLHIAVIIAFLTVLLKVLKIKRLARLLIISIFLVFYSYMCGFVPTVVRSAIMGVVFLISISIGEKYDGLASLSFSAILLLFLNPLNLYGIGFQLSFVAMFSIFTLYDKSIRLISNNYLRKILSPILITIYANLLTMPIISYYFNSFSTYGIISNLIAVPILSLAYIIVFTLTCVVAVLPFLSFLYIIPEFMISISVKILSYIIELPYSFVKLFTDGYLTLFVVLILAFFVKYFMVDKKIKFSVVVVLFMVFTSLIYSANLPVNSMPNSLSFSYMYESNIFMVNTSTNKSIIVGNGDFRQSDFEKLMNTYRIRNADVLVIYGFNLSKLEIVNEIISEYSIDNIYIFSSYDYETIEIKGNNVHMSSTMQECYYDDVMFKPIFNDNNKIYGLNMNISDKSLLVLNKITTKSDFISLSFLIDDYYDVLISNTFKYDINDLSVEYKHVVYHNKNYDNFNSNNIYLEECVDFTLLY